jgi:NitT/TauT family transport system permease protein
METVTSEKEMLERKRKKDGSFSEIMQKKALPYLGILILLGIWEIAVRILELPSYLLPAPSEIARVMVERADLILEHSWVTAYEMIMGYLLAIAIAIPMAIAITASPNFDRFITPILLFFQTVPKISLAPLFLVWFGVGILPKVLVAFLISFFPIIIDTAVGLRSIAPEMVDLARSMGATRFQIFYRFRLPTSLPYLFSGLKVASTLAVVGAVVGEFVGADRGLGYLLLVANSNLLTALMFGAIFALTAQGLILFYLIQSLETLLIPWHISVRSGEEYGTM